jgi:hypothetical protein
MMPIHGSPVVFTAAASARTYVLDISILVTERLLSAKSFGMSDCILDNIATSRPLPLSAAPKLLVECIPILGGAARFMWSALGDFVAALAFAKEYVGAVLDLSGDARAGYSGKVNLIRPALPLPAFYYRTVFEPEKLYVSPDYPHALSIDNHDYIEVGSLSAWTADTLSLTGVLHYDDCQPDCASGQQISVPVDVVATDPQTCTVQLGTIDAATSEKAYVYSKIDVRALGASPRPDLVGNSVLRVCTN